MGIVKQECVIIACFNSLSLEAAAHQQQQTNTVVG